MSGTVGLKRAEYQVLNLMKKKVDDSVMMMSMTNGRRRSF
jgi:ATP-dependent 26S proteasome regulatory subunit